MPRIIDAHVHLWETQNGIVNGRQVVGIGNGKSDFGGEIRQMMPPYMEDNRNTIERLIANMDYARVSGSVITQEYIDGNQDARFFYHAEIVIYSSSEYLHCGTQSHVRIDKRGDIVTHLSDFSVEYPVVFLKSTFGEETVEIFGIGLYLQWGSRVDKFVWVSEMLIEEVKYLKKKGYKIDEVSVDVHGKVRLDELKSLLGDDVALVSVMWGNNETGTIQDIKEIGKLAHECGAYFHSDATQAIGKIKVSVKECGVDYLSLSAHKFYGPKGVGVLYVANKAPLTPFVHGGHQEKGYSYGDRHRERG